ncbi:MAG: HAD-IIA family hydrolase, partial [Dorea sp.]
LDYKKVEKACELLFRSDVDYIGTNPDLRCPTGFGFVPDCGAICMMLNLAVDREPFYVGKPNKDIVTMCMEQVGALKEEVLVVGDRLYTDIACGLNADVETALVYTGEAQPEDILDTPYPPDYTFINIRELYEALRRGE